MSAKNLRPRQKGDKAAPIVLATKTMSNTELQRQHALQRMQGRLNGLSEKAVTALEKALDEGGSVAVTAANSILDRAFGKVARQVNVQSKVEHSHEVYLSSLRELTLRKLTGDMGQNGPVIEANPLETVENNPVTTKQPLKSWPDSVTGGDPDSDSVTGSDSDEAPPTGG